MPPPPLGVKVDDIAAPAAAGPFERWRGPSTACVRRPLRPGPPPRVLDDRNVLLVRRKSPAGDAERRSHVARADRHFAFGPRRAVAIAGYRIDVGVGRGESSHNRAAEARRILEVAKRVARAHVRSRVSV